MKHRKDVPRKYRKFVRWCVVKANWEVHSFHTRREFALSFLHCSPNTAKGCTVQPVLCLPLSMIEWVGLTTSGAYFVTDPEKGPADA